MGPEEILVTEFGRHASLGYSELYKKKRSPATLTVEKQERTSYDVSSLMFTIFSAV